MTPTEIVDKANAVGKTLTGDFKQVRQLIDDAEIAWAVWRGGEMMIVKGETILRFITKSGVPEELSWTAIPCVSFEQAQSLKEVLAHDGKRPAKRKGK